MGYSNWSSKAYKARQNHRKATNTTAFTYDKHVRSSGQVAIHPQMNPFGATRESRDSAAHPDSVAIAVMFDVTGSMGQIPRVLQTKLGALMRMLVEKGYLAHPQILFGAVGDAYTDRVPLQVGQFESGLEMDDDLGKIFIEGGGGGQVHESYELAMYFFAHHTSIDCYEKRGKKGYLFTMGDEKPYAVVRQEQVAEHIGDELTQDVPTEKVIAKLLDQYEYFHIIPTNSYHGKRQEVQDTWKQYLGERVLLLDDEAAVCETIALAVGLCEGTLDDLYAGAAAMAKAGSNKSATASATNALTTYAQQRPANAKMATAVLPALSKNGSDGRL